jgi:hypothetical protein
VGGEADAPFRADAIGPRSGAVPRARRETNSRRRARLSRALATRRRRLGDLGICENQRFRRAIDALDRAGHEIATVGREVEGLAGLRLAGIRDDRAVAEELQTAVEAAPHREVALEEIAGSPVPDCDAEAVAEVVLGVARDVDAVPSAFGSARSRGFFDACSAHALEHPGWRA